MRLLCVIAALVAVSIPPVAIAEDGQKAVLITGASSGIGRYTAEHLAEQGYFVYAGARKAADMEALNKIDNVMAVRLDVTDQAQIDAAVALVEEQGRGLWGLVNNAGVNVVAPIIEFDTRILQAKTFGIWASSNSNEAIVAFE